MIKAFPAEFVRLYGLQRSQLVVFLELAAQIDDDSNAVIINEKTKKIIEQKTGISGQSLHNCLGKLCKANVLARMAKSVYMVDPYIFAFGSEQRVLKNRLSFDGLLQEKGEAK